MERDKILEGAHMNPGNICIYTISIDIGFFIVSGRREIFSLPVKGA